VPAALPLDPRPEQRLHARGEGEHAQCDEPDTRFEKLVGRFVEPIPLTMFDFSK
jgi:hypothetical protein